METYWFTVLAFMAFMGGLVAFGVKISRSPGRRIQQRTIHAILLMVRISLLGCVYLLTPYLMDMPYALTGTYETVSETGDAIRVTVNNPHARTAKERNNQLYLYDVKDLVLMRHQLWHLDVQMTYTFCCLPHTAYVIKLYEVPTVQEEVPSRMLPFVLP